MSKRDHLLRRKLAAHKRPPLCILIEERLIGADWAAIHNSNDQILHRHSLAFHKHISRTAALIYWPARTQRGAPDHEYPLDAPKRSRRSIITRGIFLTHITAIGFADRYATTRSE